MNESEKAVMQRALDVWQTSRYGSISHHKAMLLAMTDLGKAIAQPVQPTPPFGDKRKAAMAVYTPPFTYRRGYIFDSQNLMVADKGEIDDDQSVKGAVASRVRGWGKLGYLPNGAELQDEIGQMMADSLNALYAHNAQSVQPATLDAEIAALRQVAIIAGQVLRDMQSQDLMIAWQTVLEEAIAQAALPVQEPDIHQQNQQLRGQNTALDLRCAEYEQTVQPPSDRTTVAMKSMPDPAWKGDVDEATYKAGWNDCCAAIRQGGDT